MSRISDKKVGRKRYRKNRHERNKNNLIQQRNKQEECNKTVVQRILFPYIYPSRSLLHFSAFKNRNQFQLLHVYTSKANTKKNNPDDRLKSKRLTIEPGNATDDEHEKKWIPKIFKGRKKKLPDPKERYVSPKKRTSSSQARQKDDDVDESVHSHWEANSRESMFSQINSDHKTNPAEKKPVFQKPNQHDADVLGLNLPYIDVDTKSYDPSHGHSSSSSKNVNYVAVIPNRSTNPFETSQTYIPQLKRKSAQYLPPNDNIYNVKRNDSLYKNMTRTKRSQRMQHNATNDELFLGQQSLENIKEGAVLNFRKVEKSDSYLPAPLTSFMPCINDIIDTSHAEAIKQVKDLVKSVFESESAIKNAVSKYITDQNLQKSLSLILTDFTKLQLDTERRASALTNDLYMKQVDIINFQRDSLNQTVQYLMTRNRQLQEENDLLEKQNEVTLVRLKMLYEGRNSPFNHSQVQNENPVVLDGGSHSTANLLRRNNDKLRSRLTSNISQLEALELELNRTQRRNGDLMSTMRDLRNEIESQKNLHIRAQDDYKLEITSINHDLTFKSSLLNECQEAGKIMIKDINRLNQTLQKNKHTPDLLSTSSFSTKSEKVNEIINFGRDCLNILVQQVLSAQHNLDLANKDTINLTQQLEVLKTELLQYQEKCTPHTQSPNNLTNRESMLLQNLEVIKARLQNLLNEYETFRNSSNTEKETLNQKLNEYEHEIKELRQYLVMTSHLNSEKHQLSQAEKEKLIETNRSLETALKETGTKDLTENLAVYQAQCYKLHSDNTALRDQITNYINERDTIVDYQNKYYQHLLRLHNEMIALKEKQNALQKELTAEKDRRVGLQFDNKRLFEKTQSCKSLDDALKMETALVKELEKKINNLQNDLSKLAIVYDYSKQTAEHQRDTLKQRERTIQEMEQTMSKLLDQHSVDLEDKVALCSEVTALVAQQKQLSENLEKAQQQDQMTLQQLADEYQKMANKRDELLMKNQSAMANEKHLMDKIQTKTNECNCLGQRLLALEKKLDEHIDCNKLMKVQQNDQQRVNQYEEKIEQLKNEKSTLENSVTFLQCTSKNQHEDLNQTRKTCP